MQISAGRAARLMRRLGWCLVLVYLVSGPDGLPPVAFVAAVLAAHWLQQLAEIVDHRPARRLLSWGSVAAGGAAVAAGWTRLAPTDGSLALWSAMALVVGLYAAGLASWVWHHGGRSLARRLQAGLALWTVTFAVTVVAYASGTPFDPNDPDTPSASVLDRAIDPRLFWLTVVPAAAAAGLLIAAHGGVRVGLSEIDEEHQVADAAEPDSGRSTAPAEPHPPVGG